MNFLMVLGREELNQLMLYFMVNFRVSPSEFLRIPVGRRMWLYETYESLHSGGE